MKIDVSTIEGYDAMSAEEKLNAVLNAELNDPEVTKWKEQANKASSEAADWKKKHNALLSEEDRKANENAEALQNLQTELETLRKEKAVSGYTARCLEAGFTSEEASKAASSLADGDIDTFFVQLKSFTDGLKKSIKAELMQSNPVPGSVGGTDTIMTKEKYDKLTNHDKLQFIQNHHDEYVAMKKRS